MTDVTFAIREAEKKTDHVLSPEQNAFLERCLSQLLMTAAVKWVAGQKEHGGDIRDRDLRTELMQESIDTFFYAIALPVKCPNEPPGSGPSSS
jgi:hypothetical protein